MFDKMVREYVTNSKMEKKQSFALIINQIEIK